MATPATALDWKRAELEEPEELCEPAQIVSWEETPASSFFAVAVREELEAELRQASQVLQLHEDQDVQAIPYSAETLARAVAFLRTHIEWLWRSYGVKMAIPTIGLGPNGSVDLYWKKQSWELLVNVPPIGPATYYGDNYGREKNKGSFDPEKLSTSVIAWLMT